MSHRNFGRSAVLIVRPSPGWRPSSHHSVPLAVVSAEFLARRLYMHRASAIASAYNRDAFRNFTGKWALCVFAKKLGGKRQMAR